MDIQMETERLILRKMLDSDLEALLRVFADPENMRFYPQPFDKTKMQGWIDWNTRNYTEHGVGLWAVTLKETPEVIGDCGLVPQEVDGVWEWEIGYHIRRDLQGRGLATEAAQACRDYGFKHLECDRLVSLILPKNTASRRVAEKNGMALVKQTEWKNKIVCVYACERSIATAR